jgi:hypothetical protein
MLNDLCELLNKPHVQKAILTKDDNAGWYEGDVRVRFIGYTLDIECDMNMPLDELDSLIEWGIDLGHKHPEMHLLTNVNEAREVWLDGAPNTDCVEGNPDLIEDGFGNTWSIVCDVCGKRTMQVVRPGMVQCPNCG